MIQTLKIKNTAIIFSLLIIAFSTWSANSSARIFPQPVIYNVVTVYGYVSEPQGVYINVDSGGCTNPSQFAFEVQRDATLIAKIQLLRKKNDLCLRYMPLGQWIYFDYAEMGLKANENFEIINPDPGAPKEKIFPGLKEFLQN